jgi:hypothetical protein
MFSPRYNVSINGEKEEINTEHLSKFARLYEMDPYVPGRFSWFFVLQMYMYQKIYGIEPAEIMESIKELEGLTTQQQIKSETQFKHKPLKGLWHKHYFSARFVGKNLKNYHGKSGVQKVITSHCHEGAVFKKETIRNIANDLIHKAFENRLNDGKLTCEWIIFAKYENKNYYLALGEHDRNDKALHKTILSTCSPQFPFLKEIIGDG